MKIKLDENYFDLQPFYPGQVINEASVYTIWTFDPNTDDYQLLYVGECSDEGITLDEDHKSYLEWEICQISSLYYAIKPMPENEFTRDERMELKQFLIELYRPICNI
jgi:hypothetical protein